MDRRDLASGKYTVFEIFAQSGRPHHWQYPYRRVPWHYAMMRMKPCLRDAPERRFRELAKGSPFHIHIMGHSHTPYYKIIDGIHFINPGSVGRMFDGDPRTAFAILKLSSDGISVEHFRIPYPVEAVVAGLKQNRLPNIYGKMYRMGRKLN